MKRLVRKRVVYTCWALDCETVLPSKRLMCPVHWKVVPKEIKSWINRSYKAGDRPGNKKAVMEAVRFVYKVEQLTTEVLSGS